jgi:tetratricopeptide (TPR) repeat protein
MHALTDELDNFRAAMSWAERTGADEARWRIAVGLSEVWQTRGHLVEARAWLERGLDRARLPDELRAEVLDDASTIALRQGRLDESAALAERQLDLARQLDQPRRAVSALAKIAGFARASGDADRARALLDEAVAIAGRDTDRRPLLVSLTSQANADLLAGRVELAIEGFERCLELAVDVGRPESVATAWFNVGLARLIEGRDDDAARTALGEALDRYEALDDIEGIGYVLVAAARLFAPTDTRRAAEALAASAAALESVDARLEAVESQLRRQVEDDIRAASGSVRPATDGAGGRDDWIRIARAGLGS